MFEAIFLKTLGKNILGFVLKFWREFLILGLCAIVALKQNTIADLEQSIEDQRVEYRVLDARCSANIEKIDEYNKGVEELAKKNEELSEKIQQSNIVIGKIGANGNKILQEIQKMKIPETCEGKLQWLRDEAVKEQGEKK